MRAIQALSTSFQGLMAHQQFPPPLRIEEVEPETGPTPPLPLELEEPIEFMSVATYHKAFMSAKPPNFMGNERPNRIEGG